VEALDGVAWVVQVSDLHLSAFNYLPDHYARFGDKEGDLRCAPGAPRRARPARRQRARRRCGACAAGLAAPQQSARCVPRTTVAVELPTLLLSSRPKQGLCKHLWTKR
jgi:hypothetical protein